MAHLLYIHGFLSSRHSHKAKLVSDWLSRHRPDISFDCPDLSPYPDTAAARLREAVEARLPEPVYLLGSSLGGYYATWLVEEYGLRAVLINPAVAPYRLMGNYLDQELKNYHTDETYRLDARHVAQLRALETDGLQYPAHYWLMVQTGDETLDYREAVSKYSACKQLVEEGGDHSFQNFESRIPEIVTFLAQ